MFFKQKSKKIKNLKNLFTKNHKSEGKYNIFY